jgi:MFS family permease
MLAHTDGSAYLLTCCSLMVSFKGDISPRLTSPCLSQPLAGRAYAFFSQKYTFLVATLLFELGSIVSAVAQSSTVFILGRALQGKFSAMVSRSPTDKVL